MTKLNHHKCRGTIVYPEGLDGEKICSNCGLSYRRNAFLHVLHSMDARVAFKLERTRLGNTQRMANYTNTMSCQLNLPNFPYREEAARTIRKQNHLLFQSQKLSKNKRATVAALIHLILKEYDKTRPIKEISKELCLDSRAVMKQAWLLNKKLNSTKVSLKISRKTASDYLFEFAGKITKDKDLILDAEKILARIKRSGGNPIGLAAGAFYLACKKKKINISKEKIGETFSISERTVYTNEAKIRKLLTMT